MTVKLVLSVLPEKLGVCRFESGVSVPEFLRESSFYAITGTPDETSLVCPEDRIPSSCPAEKGFRALKVEGPLDFTLIGILASLLKPLADSGIAVFVISTYDTDYILVKDEKLNKAVDALSAVATVKC